MSGLSRSLADTPPRRSGHVTGPDGTDSQADSAGSIPVTRSTVKAQIRLAHPEKPPPEQWLFGWEVQLPLLHGRKDARRFTAPVPSAHGRARRWRTGC